MGRRWESQAIAIRSYTAGIGRLRTLSSFSVPWGICDWCQEIKRGVGFSLILLLDFELRFLRGWKSDSLLGIDS
jgi:hypothetical protein